MSSISVTKIEFLSSIYNKFSKDLEGIISNLEIRCKEDNILSKNVRDEVEKLRNDISKILKRNAWVSSYTTPSPQQYEQTLRKEFENISENALRIKKMMEEIKLKRKEVLKRWESLKGFTKYADVKKVKEKVDNIVKLTKRDMEDLIKEIEQVLEFIEFYEQVQGEFREKPLPQGKGELHKEIWALAKEIENLKSSTTLIPKKIEILERNSSKIKKLLDTLNSISGYLDENKLDEYSMNKMVSKDRAKSNNTLADKEKADKDKKKLNKEIKDFLSLLEEIDEEEYHNILKEVKECIKKDKQTLLKNVRDRVKIAYAEVKEKYCSTQVYKDDINTILKDADLLSPEIIDLGKSLLDSKYIDLKEYLKFVESYWKEIEKNRVIRGKKEIYVKFLNKLATKGYTLVVPEDKTLEEIALETELLELENRRSSDYKVQVKLDEQGNIITRVVKEVDEGGVSEYERQRDIEEAKKWCNSYKETIKEMNQEGYSVEIKAIKEPEEVGITYVKKQKKNRKGETSKDKKREREKSL